MTVLLQRWTYISAKPMSTSKGPARSSKAACEPVAITMLISEMLNMKDCWTYRKAFYTCSDHPFGQCAVIIRATRCATLPLPELHPNSTCRSRGKLEQSPPQQFSERTAEDLCVSWLHTSGWHPLKLGHDALHAGLLDAETRLPEPIPSQKTVFISGT